MGRSIGSFDSNDGATPLVAGPIASVLALQARSSYWTSARGNPPGHWSPPGAHQKDRGTGGGRLLPASRLGPSGLPTPGSDRMQKGTDAMGPATRGVAPSLLSNEPMERPMKRNDLSRSLVAFDQASTMVAVVDETASWCIPSYVVRIAGFVGLDLMLPGGRAAQSLSQRELPSLSPKALPGMLAGPLGFPA